MPELSITRLENRVTIVGPVRTREDRDLLRQLVIAAVADAVAREPGEEIVLDVAHAGYLDTAALTSLVLIARRCVDVGARLTLEGANDDLREQLRVAKIDQLLGCHGARLVPTNDGDSTGAAA